MGLVVPKPFGRFRQYRKSIGLEVQDPDRLLVEDLAGGREEVIGRFATVSERYAHIIDSAKIRAGDTLSSVIFGDGNK